MKKPTIKTAKAKAWRRFSHFIRLRDCYATTGDSYRGRCVTCNIEKDFGELQAGHFVDSRSKGVLFDERIVNSQCYSCNVPKKGNKDAYWPVMLKRYGKDECEKMVNQKHLSGNWSIPELQEIEAMYKHKTNELAQNQP